MSLFGFLSPSGGKGATRLPSVDATTARKWHASESCMFIDIREDAEYRVEHIPGAQLVPLSRLESAMPARRDNVKAVFYCLGGTRTSGCAARLAAAGFAEAYILDGGIRAWKGVGAPTER